MFKLNSIIPIKLAIIKVLNILTSLCIVVLDGISLVWVKTLETGFLITQLESQYCTCNLCWTAI